MVKALVSVNGLSVSEHLPLYIEKKLLQGK